MDEIRRIWELKLVLDSVVFEGYIREFGFYSSVGISLDSVLPTAESTHASVGKKGMY